MRDAPRGALFVWVNHHLAYPRLLAEKLGRKDLMIVSPDWLVHPTNLAGLRLPGVVVDHAAHLTERQWDGFNWLRQRLPEGHHQDS